MAAPPDLTVFRLLSCLLCILFLLQPAHADDVKCLQHLKSSLVDPQDHLSNWDFTNTTAGFICGFFGVKCWNDHENRLLKLELPDFQLSGEIFESLKLCSTDLQYIDLSGNSFSGSIPSSICSWLPYLVSLDFSSNQLAGEIPAGIGSCQYLNKLDLSKNQLSGSIPFQLASLNRLNDFSVANNNLTGSIPNGLGRFFISLTPSSCMRDVTHKISEVVSARALYSASVDERATDFCLRELHEIGVDPK